MRSGFAWQAENTENPGPKRLTGDLCALWRFSSVLANRRKSVKPRALLDALRSETLTRKVYALRLFGIRVLALLVPA
ncbi:hypothetical protein GCM10022254_74130 [Actinomadura meridiana]|uniref:Uncharacterized protein n=1 Tax=Actinomadura meridiana TaxID=559626 RepID=A0ABP8CR29_9ACTN